jgi:alanine racemase
MKSRTAPADSAVAIKASAYGLGAERAAPALFAAGCRHFFVAVLSEAIALRVAVPAAEIYVLSGPLGGDEPEYRAYRLTPVLNSRPQIELWWTWSLSGDAVPAALHVDTGMSRLGLSADELEWLADNPKLLALMPIRVMLSHLSCAEETDNPLNRQQLARFHAAVDRLAPLLPRRPLLTFANSSGIFLGPDFHFDFIRPGAALYGINPTPGALNPMNQVVGLKARILQTRQIDQGQAVGYGAHRSTRATRLATLGLGYADGIPRSLTNVGAAFVGKVRAPFVGRVSMDLITIDVGDVPAHLAEPGAWVEILGPQQSADDLGATAGTIGYEILTSLGSRYQRRYLPAG